MTSRGRIVHHPANMRFLTVAERELREGARRKATYRARWLTAVAFFGLLLWLMWVHDAYQIRGRVPRVFTSFSIFTFLYCIVMGTVMTADCLSSERREGTLGLLFLTNLNSVEIIIGKLCSSALTAIYGLLAIFPMLALPLLMGGVTFDQFGKTLLALLVTILFSISAGFVASVICRRQFLAVAVAMGLAFSYGTGLMLAAKILNSFGRGRGQGAAELAALCPLHTLIAAIDPRVFGKNYYWFSVIAVTAISLLWLCLVTWRLSRTWRDRPKGPARFARLKVFGKLGQLGGAGRLALRRRLLDSNPFYWLGGRKLVSAPFFMLLILIAVLLTSYVTAPFFGRVMAPGTGTLAPMIGLIFAWFWTGLAIHGLVTYYAAMVASQRLAEDKQTGALELILSTPTNERIISRGLWMAYARRMFFPVLIAVMVHFYVLWLGMTMCTFDPPGRIPRDATAWQIFWAAVLDRRMNGYALEWGFVFVIRCALLMLVGFLLLWLTLGWVGRWLGLRMKHPGFAPVVALAWMFVPPILVFTAACIIGDKLNLDRLPERQAMPLMMWVTVAIAVGHCLIMAIWAGRNLRSELRTIVMNRYQPPVPRRWVPRLRTVVRFAAGGLGLAGAAVLILLLFFGYQNWRSRHAWNAFQKDLKRRGETLNLSALLPAPIPSTENFALSSAFQTLRSGTNAQMKKILESTQMLSPIPNSTLAVDWTAHRYLALNSVTKVLLKKSELPLGTNRADHAPLLLAHLNTYDQALRELSAAARLPGFRMMSNNLVREIFRSQDDTLKRLEQLHLLFEIRACSLLAVNRVPEAGEDVLTTLQLARLARQSLDAGSTARMQTMTVRSLQPIWEGLVEHQWTEAQLAEFQTALASFNHLSDYTNAVRRVVLANIEIWQGFPTNRQSAASVPQNGGYVQRPEWAFQPRAWWFDSCIQLYAAGENATKRVDVAANRFSMDFNWSDLQGLTLDSETSGLLQQFIWGGSGMPSVVPFAQTALNQGIIACALERYRLVHGKLPQRLDELVPMYLNQVPYDVVVGRPMGYQRISDERFILRGVGPNEIDDRKNAASDDWLWQYPTNAPAIKK